MMAENHQRHWAYMTKIVLIPAFATLLLLAACGAPEPAGPAPGNVKIGKPYVIGGKTYYPEYDSTYDKIGVASWYGPGFHGSRTANGEVFDTHDLTAAHPTLPMPSLVPGDQSRQWPQPDSAHQRSWSV